LPADKQAEIDAIESGEPPTGSGLTTQQWQNRVLARGLVLAGRSIELRREIATVMRDQRRSADEKQLAKEALLKAALANHLERLARSNGSRGQYAGLPTVQDILSEARASR
jgi:hypothetical protein